MTPDPETLMAYADGELDDIAAARVARAIAADPALARQVEAHRALRTRLADGFAPVAAEAVPDRFAALLVRSTNVVSMEERRRARRSWWPITGAIAASLVVGVMTGQMLGRGAAVIDGQAVPVAGGALARALDTQLASAQDGAAVRMIASFRDTDGDYCRIFAAPAASGIACRQDDGWVVRRTAGGAAAQTGAYRQAGSGDAEMLAAAQDMMAGEPLDAAGEVAARSAGWR